MIRRLSRLWHNLRHRHRVERELHDELQATLDLLIDEKVAKGIGHSEARRRALIEMNGIEPVKERVRDVRMGVWLERLRQDVAYAWRHLRRAPGFASTAIFTLALGIGANTAMFSMLNAIVLKRIAVPDPDGLMAIAPTNARGLPRSMPMSAVAELKDGPLDHLCAYLGAVVFPIMANETPVQTLTTFVTGECFDAFGIRPILGRAITSEDSPIYGKGAQVAVISHRLWTGAYGGAPDVLGKTILINNVTATIVGVLPRGFLGLDVDGGVDVYTPFDAVLPAAKDRRQLASYLLGRLRPGISVESAAAQIQTQWPALLQAVVPAGLAPTERAQLLDSTPHLVSIGTGTSRIRERYAQPLTLVLGLTSLLLLVACVNLGSLLLARTNARTPELSLRLALGGTRWRIAQQMLIESLMLSISGAILALPIAYYTAITLASFIPPMNVPYGISFVPDGRVFVTTAAIAVAVAVAMSAWPLWLTARRASIQLRTDRTVVGVSRVWARVMLVAQVAAAIVMLIDAVLLTRSLYLLNSGDLGIQADNVLTIKLWQLPNAPSTRTDRGAYYPPLLEKVRALPGVDAAALTGNALRTSSRPVGSLIAWQGSDYGNLTTDLELLSPGYFSSLGIELLAGRDIEWSDTLATQKIGIVSESLARALAPDGDVLGRAVHIRTMPTDLEYTIVGVVADATLGDPHDGHPRVVYRPVLQTGANNSVQPNLIIRTKNFAATTSAVREIVRELGRDYVQEVISANELLARAPATERISATVASVVGGIAVLLVLIGVHGTLAYAVSRRTREIGVRLALGASPTAAARSVVREALLVCVIGVAIGLPAAALSARSLRSLMFGITEYDPATFVLVAATFVILGLCAGIAPARRAATVDPVTALRAE